LNGTRTWSAVLTLAIGCAGEPVEIRLIHPVELMTADFTSTTIEILDAETDAVVQSTTTASTVDEALELPDLDATELELGGRYRIRIKAEHPVCTKRAVGESLPFEHRADAYVVSVQIGCADEFTRTRRRPNVSRFGASLVATADGRAVLIGGAREISVPAGDLPQLLSVTSATERYDPAIGAFLPAASLTVPRAGATTVALDDGAVAVFGGATGDARVCSSNVDRLFGLSVAAVQELEVPRCSASAALVRDASGGRILVAGGAASSDIEIYDERAGAHSGASIASAQPRGSPELVALAGGESALLVAGAATEPLAELVTTTGVTPISGGPAGGLRETAAVYVRCANPASGEPPGVVYLLGGLDGAGTNVSDEIWCYRDDGSSALELAGQLPTRRRAAVAVALRDRPLELPRVLLIGGAESAPGGPGPFGGRDAAVVPVNGCGCEAYPGTELAVPIESDFLVGHSAAVLADGSVLVVGGLDFDSAEHAVATGEAVLFIPDVP
jgi:hypothetical protein